MNKQNITVCTFSTRGYKKYADQLGEDCKKFGYDFYNFFLDIPDAENISDIWLLKPKYVVEAIEKFDRILWLDAECRIVKPFPDRWFDLKYEMVLAAKLYGTDEYFPLYNSGFKIIDHRNLQLMKDTNVICNSLLKHINDDIEIFTKFHGIFSLGIGDEEVFDMMLLQLCTVRNVNKLIEYLSSKYNRFNPNLSCVINRGTWEHENTIITHPNSHHLVKYLINDHTKDGFAPRTSRIFLNEFVLPDKSELEQKLIVEKICKYLTDNKIMLYKILKLMKGTYHTDKDVYEYNDWYFNGEICWKKSDLHLDNT